MSIALLISGLPRYVEKGYSNIFKSLIEPNNPDIFIHTWNDIDGTFNYPVKELYKPVSMKCEDQKSWRHSKMNLDRMMASHARSYHRDKFVEMLHSSWYSIQEANLLKEQHRLHHDLVYEYVIRARFDLYYNEIVDCKKYDNSILHVSNKWLPDIEMTDDRFAFGSENIMNAYCGGFNLLNIIQANRHKKDGIFCGETLVYEMCKMFNITSKQIGGLTVENISHMVAQGRL